MNQSPYPPICIKCGKEMKLEPVLKEIGDNHSVWGEEWYCDCKEVE